MDRVRSKEVKLTHVATRDQIANIFTKALPAELFNDFKMMLKMKDRRDLSLRGEFLKDKLKSQVAAWKWILKKKTKTRPKTTKLNTKWKRSKKTKPFETEKPKVKAR
nr:hypothetical protein [Tanacetum cinerariifolium]